MKVGDKVIMSDLGKDRYMDEDYNPHNTLGVIDDAFDDGGFEFHVTWRNGWNNIYTIDELQVIQC